MSKPSSKKTGARAGSTSSTSARKRLNTRGGTRSAKKNTRSANKPPTTTPPNTTATYSSTPTRKAPARPRLTAATADRHELYERAVQCVESEIDFVDAMYKKLRGRRASLLREDFCGTANTSCEWVRRRDTNKAVGVDIDPNPMNWGKANHIAKLSAEQQKRITLKRANVLENAGGNFDIVLAMNFSYWCLMTRADMLRYFKNVKRSLKKDGVFFLDFYGGADAHREMEETRAIPGDRKLGLEGFDYIWDQAHFNPVTGFVQCYIHFGFKDSTRMEKAFSYQWRLYTLPEIKDILADAGFSKVTTYLEGDDGKGGGDGKFKASDAGEADDSFICYITAEK